MASSYEKLLQPLQVAGLRLKNRMLSAPTSLAELGPGEHYSDDNINYYKLKAAGGAALVSVGDVIVDLSTGRSHPMQVGLDDPTAIPYLVKMADAIHSGGGGGGDRDRPRRRPVRPGLYRRQKRHRSLRLCGRLGGRGGGDDRGADLRHR